MNAINEKIRDLRVNKGLTQQQVADQLFVTRQAVSRWEQGKNLPDIEMMYKLSDVLGVQINEILDNDAHKRLTIEQVNQSVKSKRITWISIIVSISAIVIAASAFAFSKYYSDSLVDNMEDEPEFTEINIVSETAIIEELSLNQNEITVRTNTGEIVVVTTTNEDILFVYNNKLEKIDWSELKQGDLIEIEYDTISLSPYKITVFESVVQNLVSGVFVNIKGEEFDTFDSIIGYGSQVPRASSGLSDDDFVSTISNNSFITTNLIVENYSKELISEVVVYIDCLNISEDITIGTYDYTDESVDIQYRLSECPDEESFTLYGEKVTETSPSEFMIYSYDVIFNVRIVNVPTFTEITVYEYDETMTLIRTTVIEEVSDILSYHALDDSLSATILLKQTNTEGDTEYITEQLNIGDIFLINYTSGEGLVFPLDLRFQYLETYDES